MSPIYEEWGSWFFDAFGQKFGPFPTEDEAWDKYQELHARQCPSCEE